MKKLSFLMLLALVASSFAACEFSFELGGEDADSEEAATEMEQVENVPADTTTNHYQDDYLSFDYPDGIALFAENAFNPAYYDRSITFAVWNEEKGSYEPAGLGLDYIYELDVQEFGIEVDQDYDSLKDLYANSDVDVWDEDVPFYEEFDFGDRTGFIYRGVVPAAGYEVNFYTPFLAEDDVNPYHVYKMSRNSIDFNKDIVEEIIDMFVDTVEFY